MKCKRCNGKGYLEYEHGLIQVVCDKCKGTGNIKETIEETNDKPKRKPRKDRNK